MGNLMIKNQLQVLFEEKKLRDELYSKMSAFCEGYSSVDSIFDRSCRDVTKGFFDEGKTYGTLQEACLDWDADSVLRINTDEGKYTLGKIKPFNECQGKIFDVESWKYIN